MTSSEKRPIGPTALTDEELTNVSAEKGHWCSWRESSLKRQWANRVNLGDTNLGFEDWLKTWKTEDELAARAAWIADGSPDHVTYYYEAGKTWTEVNPH